MVIPHGPVVEGFRMGVLSKSPEIRLKGGMRVLFGETAQKGGRPMNLGGFGQNLPMARVMGHAGTHHEAHGFHRRRVRFFSTQSMASARAACG